MENCVKALKKCPCKVFASLCFLAVLLSGIICLIGLTYDGSAKWIDDRLGEFDCKHHRNNRINLIYILDGFC